MAINTTLGKLSLSLTIILFIFGTAQAQPYVDYNDGIAAGNGLVTLDGDVISTDSGFTAVARQGNEVYATKGSTGEIVAFTDLGNGQYSSSQAPAPDYGGTVLSLESFQGITYALVESDDFNIDGLYLTNNGQNTKIGNRNSAFDFIVQQFPGAPLEAVLLRPTAVSILNLGNGQSFQLYEFEPDETPAAIDNVLVSIVLEDGGILEYDANLGGYVNIGSTPINGDFEAVGDGNGGTVYNGLSNGLLLLNQSPTVLPVSYIYAQAEARQKDIEISFATATEQQASHFSIRATNDNGRSWRHVGRVAASGTTSQRRDYSVLDEMPRPGRNDYVIDQVDFDGTTHISVIFGTDFKGVRKEAHIAPNPIVAGHVLTVEGQSITRIELFNTTGQYVKSFAVMSELDTHNITIPLNIPKGLVTLKFTDKDGNVSSQRLLVR